MLPTELIAHRGASLERPENTLPAFARALELGADAIELDVHVTADGCAVVHHDATPRATAADPTLARRPITQLTARELATFRVASESIPALADVLDLIGDRAMVYVELKGVGVTPVVLACVLGHPRTRCALHSFDHSAVAEARARAPSIPGGLLLSSYNIDPGTTLRAASARDLWPAWELIDQRLIDRTHAAGGRVLAWTVNGCRAARELAAMGVDGLCTDDVASLRAAVAPGLPTATGARR